MGGLGAQGRDERGGAHEKPREGQGRTLTGVPSALDGGGLRAGGLCPGRRDVVLWCDRGGLGGGALGLGPLGRDDRGGRPLRRATAGGAPDQCRDPGDEQDQQDHREHAEHDDQHDVPHPQRLLCALGAGGGEALGGDDGEGDTGGLLGGGAGQGEHVRPGAQIGGDRDGPGDVPVLAHEVGAGGARPVVEGPHHLLPGQEAVGGEAQGAALGDVLGDQADLGLAERGGVGGGCRGTGGRIRGGRRGGIGARCGCGRCGGGPGGGLGLVDRGLFGSGRSRAAREGHRGEGLVVAVLDAVGADGDDTALHLSAVHAMALPVAVHAVEHGAGDREGRGPGAVGGPLGLRAREGHELLVALVVLGLGVGDVAVVGAGDAARGGAPPVAHPAEEHVDPAESALDRLEAAAAQGHLGGAVGGDGGAAELGFEGDPTRGLSARGRRDPQRGQQAQRQQQGTGGACTRAASRRGEDGEGGQGIHAWASRGAGAGEAAGERRGTTRRSPPTGSRITRTGCS